MNRKKTVLFLCTGNSCRSQMAEGWLKHLAGESIEVISAGLEPRPVHPLTVHVMDEVGIDISGQRSKSIKEYMGKATVDYAVFVCAKAEQNCPSIYPFAMNTLSWPFEDPAASYGTDAQLLAKFREIRDAIGGRIERWLGEDKIRAFVEKQPGSLAE